jgi:signal peptide peptidase SppA
MIRLMMSRGAVGQLERRGRLAITQWDKEVRDAIGEVRREDVVGTWGKVARVRLDSAVMFEPDLWTTYVSGAHPTDRVVDAIKAAAGDPDVKAIVLEMNGPGGSVAGYDDIRNAIAQAKKTKVVQTLVHDGAFSLHYRMAAATDYIAATPTAMVGSIGTIVLMYDDSALYSEAGVIPKPVASDGFKAQGWGGVPLTDEYLEHVRASIVEPDYAEFVGEVAAGRGLSADVVRSYGSLEYTAQDALSMGLVDEVVSADAFVAALAASGPRSPRPDANRAGKGVVMSMDLKALRAAHPDLVKQIEEQAAANVAAEMAQQAAKPATFAELKAEFGQDAAFVVQALDKGLTLSAARAEWNTQQKAAEAKLREELEASKAEAAKLAKLPGAGLEGINAGAGGVGNGGSANGGGDYEKLVAAKQAEGLTRIAAVAFVNKHHPKAWKAQAEKLRTAIASN